MIMQHGVPRQEDRMNSVQNFLAPGLLYWDLQPFDWIKMINPIFSLCCHIHFDPSSDLSWDPVDID